MNAMLSQKGAIAYAQVNRVSGIEGASSHQLIDMLLNGAIERLSTARGHMERKAFAEKGVLISKTIDIIDGLRVSLDTSQGELAENLDSLYFYMQTTLMKANLNNDLSQLQEVTQLLVDLRQTWNEIPNDIRQQHHGQ